MIRRSAWLKRSSKPIQRGKGIRRKGRRGRRNDKAHFDARTAFFKLFAFQGCDKTDWCARCQICGGPMGWYESNACHKIDASLSGPEEPENYLIGHQLCNFWMEELLKIKHAARESKINALTGGQVPWTQELGDHLLGFLKSRGAHWARALPYA